MWVQARSDNVKVGARVRLVRLGVHEQPTHQYLVGKEGMIRVINDTRDIAQVEWDGHPFRASFGTFYIHRLDLHLDNDLVTPARLTRGGYPVRLYTAPGPRERPWLAMVTLPKVGEILLTYPIHGQFIEGFEQPIDLVET